MTGLTQDQVRAIASLKTITGYKVLLETVIKSKVETAINNLKHAKGRDDRADASVEFVVWDEVSRLLDRLPTDALEELKAAGDAIYG